MDYIIVGAGPTGLALAYYLSKAGKKSIILDRQPNIGGCHRVLRVNGMFTEHAPRVYLSSYLNTIEWFSDMNISFYDHFTTYNYGILYIVGRIFNQLNESELAWFTWAATKLLFDPTYGKTISVKSFCIEHSFSDSSLDFLDRLCRSSDGAGADRFSMYKLLNAINQNALYQFYEPKRPNDVALFPMIQEALVNTGNIQFLLGASVVQLLMNESNTEMTGVTYQTNTQQASIMAKNVILAVSPNDLQKLLATPSPYSLAFGPLETWTARSSYIVDLGATFHWDTALSIESTWGFPSSEWMLVYIILSEYMEFEDSRSQTVVSVCITNLDIVSSVTGKTAHQTSNPDELVREMFRQFQETYPTIPQPTTMILSPTVYRENDKWTEQDSAFFNAYNTYTLPSKGTIPNLFQVGTQNGNSDLDITCFESAVTNAMAFANQSYKKPIEVRTFVIIVLAILLILLILFIVNSSLKKK